MKFLSALIALSSFIALVNAYCPDGWVLYSGRCYFFGEGSFMYWHACMNYCAALSAWPPCMRNAATNEFVRSNAGWSVWLPYNDYDNEGAWVWKQPGCNPSYTNWDSGEPNNKNNEDYAYMKSGNGKWQDVDPSRDLKCVCEKGEQTYSPSAIPTMKPTALPSVVPTQPPIVSPTTIPTAPPSFVPTVKPTSPPTVLPTSPPSNAPIVSPTAIPTTAIPSIVPTIAPTFRPSTANPTAVPTASPSRLVSLCSPDSTGPTGKCISMGPVMTWTQCRNYCTANQVSMICIRNQAEQDFVGGKVVWLGRKRNEGWQSDCIPYSGPDYSNWSSDLDTRVGAAYIANWGSQGWVNSFDSAGGSERCGCEFYPIPTTVPTPAPSRPTASPTTAEPTTQPTALPSTAPSFVPTVSPTTFPTPVPSLAPTKPPTASPTVLPTTAPSTVSPSCVPTVAPTATPSTTAPSKAPTFAPTATPSTASPTKSPTIKPTPAPSVLPTPVPSKVPTTAPTSACTAGPNNKCYKFIPGGTKTWTQCRDLCVGEGGSMLCVRDAAENAYLVNKWQTIKNDGYLMQYGNLDFAWLGYTALGTPNQYSWKGGCPAYTNTGTPYETTKLTPTPDDPNMIDSVIHFTSGGEWGYLYHQFQDGEYTGSMCACEYSSAPTKVPTPAPTGAVRRSLRGD